MSTLRGIPYFSMAFSNITRTFKKPYFHHHIRYIQLDLLKILKILGMFEESFCPTDGAENYFYWDTVISICTLDVITSGKMREPRKSTNIDHLRIQQDRAPTHLSLTVCSIDQHFDTKM